MRKCNYCDQPEHTQVGITSVGHCKLHAQMWEEDVKSGFKQNRLKEIRAGLRNIDGTLK